MLENTAHTRLVSAESVCSGHPDKVADCIADAVVDAALAQSNSSRIACEVLVTKNLVVVAGEVSCPVQLPYERIVRDTLTSLGYTSEAAGLSANSCMVLVAVHQQTSEIAELAKLRLVSDQGIVYGYATKETKEYMPLSVVLAHSLTACLNKCRQEKSLPYLLPDGKAQVTVRYVDGVAKEIVEIVISPHYDGSIKRKQILADIQEFLLKPILPKSLVSELTRFIITPFIIGGPAADTGLTGRKLAVNTYGSRVPNGGGALSGKDPTKVDRSGAYLARYIAKNIVAANLAPECLVELTYVKEKPDPLYVQIFTPHGSSIEPFDLIRHIQASWDTSLDAVIQRLHLDRPIYYQCAVKGHFGIDGNPWEELDCIQEWVALSSSRSLSAIHRETEGV